MYIKLCLEIKFFLIFYKKYNIIYIENMKGIKKMFDDFTTEIQSDELAEIQNWNDAMEDPRYLYEE